MNKLSAVLFDFDGTLIDSERFYFEAWAPILKGAFQLEISFEDWIQDFAGHTLQRNVEFLRTKFQVDTTEEFMWKRTREAFALNDMLAIPLMPFAEEIIQYLAQSHISIGLVTSNFFPVVERILKAKGLYAHFSFFVTREDVQDAKPDPACYLLALKKAQVAAAEVLVIEDTLTGARAALAAGLTCFGVTKHAAEREKLKALVPLFEDLQQVHTELAEISY